MSWCCWRKTPGVTVDVPTLLREKLSIIPSIYPNTRYSFVLSDVGDLIVMNPAEETISSTLLSTISSMRRTAMQFGAALSPNDCPVIHITGKSHMFSCYDIGSFLLAFYTDIDSESFSTFEVSSSDERMIELVSELRLILSNAIVIRARSAI